MPVDPRQRYFHAAFDVSTLFANEARRYEADGKRYPMLEASPRYDVSFRATLSGTSPIPLGWVAPYLCWNTSAVTLLNVAGLPGAGTCTLQLAESTPGAADAVTILPALTSLTTAGPLTTTARYAPLTAPRMLVITPASLAAPIELAFVLSAIVVNKPWA